MFCNQCEQTYHGTGCVDKGVCGKDEDMQSLQEIGTHLENRMAPARFWASYEQTALK